MNWEIFGIASYVIVMIGLGIYFSRRIKNDNDYYLGGRSLGPGLATFSIFATWFGAETCIGTAGAVYQNGLSSIHADPFGYSICLLIMGLVFAKILWKKQITTIPDLLKLRYSPATEKLAALIMIPSSLIWAGAQVRALGQILHATTDFGPGIAVLVAATVVIVYTTFGGMLADAYADFIQGIAIITGLVFLFLTMLIDLGGVAPTIAAIPLSKLSFGGGNFEGTGFLGKLELWLVPILGSVMAQELVSRVVSSRSESIAKNSALRAAFIYFFVGSIPVMIGLLGHHYYPQLSDPETLIPALAKAHLSYFFYIIFVGALVSAILSTVDTTLLASSALMSQNLIFPLVSHFSDRRKVIIARLCTIFAGLASYFIANSSDSITGLVEMASGLGGPIILVVTVMALWEKKGSSASAIISMGAGLGVWVIAHYVVELQFPVILTALVCCLSYTISLPFLPAEKKTERKVSLG